MSITAQVQSAVAKAFDALGDLVKTGKVINVPNSKTYDPVSDSYTYAPVEYPIAKAALVGYTDKETDGTNVKSTDIKCLFPSSYMGVYEPTTEDTYKDSTDTEYSIERAKKDPSGSLWVLQLRKL